MPNELNDTMNNPIHLERLFHRFFAHERRGKTAATARRYQRVHTQLRAFLDEVDVTGHMGTEAAALLEAERGFGRRGAFARVFDATDFVCCVPAFLGGPWLLSDAVDACSQVSLAGRLLTWLKGEGQISWWNGACAFYEAEAAVRRSRRSLSAGTGP